MIPSETDLAELESELLEFLKSLDAGIYGALLPEYVISAFRHKGDSHPVIPGIQISGNLKATTTQVIHTYLLHGAFLVAPRFLTLCAVDIIFT